MSDHAIEPTSVQTSIEIAAADSSSGLPATHTDASPAPASMGWGTAITGILNFVTLALRITALAIAAALLKEQFHLFKQRMHHDAASARRLSGHLAQAGVDAHFQTQALEVAAAFERVAEASGQLADAADQMEAGARGVRDAHQSEYGGIYEVTNALPYAQPKPGFNRVR